MRKLCEHCSSYYTVDPVLIQEYMHNLGKDWQVRWLCEKCQGEADKVEVVKIGGVTLTAMKEEK